MSETTEAPAADEPLSDDAALALIAEPGDEPAAEPDPENAAPEGEEAEPEPEEPEAEAEPEPDAEPVNAPHYWDAEAKAEFAKVPPSLQAVIAEQETNRTKAVERFVQQNTEQANKYAAETQKLEALIETAALNEELFGQIDWQKWARDDPGAYLAAKEAAQQVQTAKAEAERLQLQRFQQEEGRKLPTIDAELARPERLTAVYGYLSQQGVPQEQLQHASALELAIAHKAMKFDEAQAKAKAGKTRTPEPPRKPVKPTSAQPGTSQSRDLETLRRSFAQKPTSDAAVALIMAGNL